MSHFKSYRTHGLFGRHTGLYWWDAHVRGSVDQGVVDKEYQVHAPVIATTAEEA